MKFYQGFPFGRWTVSPHAFFLFIFVLFLFFCGAASVQLNDSGGDGAQAVAKEAPQRIDSDELGGGKGDMREQLDLAAL